MDTQAEFEMALGRAALAYSELMLLLRMSVPPLVDPGDFAVGRIVMADMTDVRLIDLWAALASHRSRSDVGRRRSVEAMKKALRKLAEERSRHLHGLYVPSADRDPMGESDLRSFERGIVRLGADGVTVTPANFRALRLFADRCCDTKADFANTFAVVERRPV